MVQSVLHYEVIYVNVYIYIYVCVCMYAYMYVYIDCIEFILGLAAKE